MKAEPKKIETKEDWEEFFTKLANPKCKATGCYGRGFTGWDTTTGMPKGCTAKGCSLRNLRALQRQQKINAMKKKNEEKVIEAVEEKNETR